MTNSTSSTNSSISIFTKLDKYSGQNNENLTSWFHSFDRCCVIARKDDDLVKGQILTLCFVNKHLLLLND